jgi:hypothetical protein
MTGDLVLKYGAQSSCSGTTDGHITVDFTYKTRTHLPDAKRDLQGKWYYKKCIEDKNSVTWQNRPATAYPFTMECFKTLYDATVARDYFWDIKFEKITEQGKNVIQKLITCLNFWMTFFPCSVIFSNLISQK